MRQCPLQTYIAILLTIGSIQISCAVPTSNKKTIAKPVTTIQIILGSTRQGRTSEKIGTLLQQLARTKAAVAAGDIRIEIVDLKDHSLPFLAEATAPAQRTTITDPAIQRWSNRIKQADAFIIVSPEYNAGYPAVLKNAFDSLYAEWHNKPVGFVTYSGGPTGGSSVLAQLQQVAQALMMKPIKTAIKIPYSSKAFTAQNTIVDQENIERKLQRMLDEIVASQRN